MSFFHHRKLQTVLLAGKRLRGACRAFNTDHIYQRKLCIYGDLSDSVLTAADETATLITGILQTILRHLLLGSRKPVRAIPLKSGANSCEKPRRSNSRFHAVAKSVMRLLITLRTYGMLVEFLQPPLRCWSPQNRRVRW